MARSSDDRSLDQRPSGRWRCRITTADGRRIAETFDTQALAAAFRDQVELDTKLRRHGLPGIIRPRPALDDLLRDWLSEHAGRVQSGTLAESTYRTYHDHVASVRLWLREGLRRPTLAADELDDRLIARYVAAREGQRRSRKAPRPASDVQIRKDLALLARIYGWAGVERRWSIPRRLRRSTGGKRVLPRIDLLRWLDAQPEGSLERTVAELAIATGMRPSDIHALRRDDVDLQARLIRFRAGKTGRDQVIPIGEHLASHLEAWLRAPEYRRTRPLDGRLLHLDGRAVTHATLRRRWRRASKAAGVEPPIEHLGMCRNAAIAYLLEDGATPYEVASLVGHSGLGLLLDYARRYVPLDALRRVAERGDRLRAR